MCVKRWKSTYLFLPSRLWLLCKAARRRWCWLCSSDMRALCSFISSLVLRWCFLTSSFISLYCFLCSRTKTFCCFSSSRVWASSSRKHTHTNYGCFWDNIHSSMNAHKVLKCHSYRWGRCEWCLRSLLLVSTSLITKNKFTCLITSFMNTEVTKVCKSLDIFQVFILFQKNKWKQDLQVLVDFYITIIFQYIYKNYNILIFTNSHTQLTQICWP